MKLKWLNLLFILLFILPNSYTQNIFDLSNSLKYAEYLYKSREYELASREYERILFMDSTNENVALQLVRSYRLSENYNSAISRINDQYLDVYKMPSEWNKEYVNLLIRTNLHNQSIDFLNQDIELESNDFNLYKSIAYCFNNDWGKAYQLSNKFENVKKLTELKSIIVKRNETNFKNLSLALGLSTLVPGLGKVYSGYWKDGLFSFIIVSVTGIQAFRGFKKNGVNSAYGWIYASLGTGFYLGNIYGSGKAVNKKNKMLNHIYIHKVEDIFNNID